jgi:hypothetical protein
MAVIINEFEVVPDDSQPGPGETPEPAERQAAPAPTLTPSDLEAMLKHQLERELRLRAD